ncbi:hypothetical protein ABI59_22240 [Acidobacteria bacterium Mor1]|nr:hypothetical protein ABI59_22240 [Acidobacteria bacterium Mor1]
MFKNYLKLAVKVLMRRKFFTLISLFGIALTLTVLVVAAAMLDQLFGPQPPESRVDRMLLATKVMMSGPGRESSSSPGYKFYETFIKDLPLAEEISVFEGGGGNNEVTYLDDRKIESALKRVDGAFWRIFDFSFIEGGPFSDDDADQGRFVAVINKTTRERFFGGEPALGKDIRIGDQTFRVVGVVEDVSLLNNLPFGEVFAPIETMPSTGYKTRMMGGFRAAVLARSTADIPEIQAAFNERIAAYELPDPETYDTLESWLLTKFDDTSREMLNEGGEARPLLLRLLIGGAMLLFMLLPAVNLMNLNLSRILERAAEIGVRKSFGATPRTLVGQFVVENVVLTLIGGVLALGLSALALNMINNADLLPYAHFRLNLRVLGYGLLLALIFGLVSGVYPAWRMSRMNPVEALRGDSR